MYKKTGCEYKKWLEIDGFIDSENNYGIANTIYIYGHSLDITDMDILKELINFKQTRTIIFSTINIKIRRNYKRKYNCRKRKSRNYGA
ncbi:hypothetical protein FZ990_08320 [Clostridium perfringens]|nr:hypothetical protein [Clostridium perfringens]